MLSSFLSDCRGVTVRKRHIKLNHFGRVRPTNSYFLICIQALLAVISGVLSGATRPVLARKFGDDKLIVWIDYGSVAGFYRRGQTTTRCIAIVIRKRNSWAYVQTAYPDIPN